MTEGKWLACADPSEMLAFVWERTSERKGRLFGCACCRRIWQHLEDASCRQAVEDAEAYADGEADESRLRRAHEAAKAYWLSHQSSDNTVAALAAAEAAIRRKPIGRHQAYVDIGFPRGYARMTPAQVVVVCVEQHIYLTSRGPEWRDANDHERAFQCRLLRDISGDLFHAATIDPAWQTPTVQSLAHAAYGERILPSGELEPARLCVLSDALEDAGCTDADILSHLRSAGPHVRGCWALDLVLGRT